MDKVQEVKQGLLNNLDKKMILSSIVAAFAVGGVVMVLQKSNIKALKSLSKLAK